MEQGMPTTPKSAGLSFYRNDKIEHRAEPYDGEQISGDEVFMPFAGSNANCSSTKLHAVKYSVSDFKANDVSADKNNLKGLYQKLLVTLRADYDGRTIEVRLCHTQGPRYNINYLTENQRRFCKFPYMQMKPDRCRILTQWLETAKPEQIAQLKQILSIRGLLLARF